MEFSPYKALYIHLPFCKRRCGYCDFSTQAIDPDDPRVERYIDDVVLQIRRASKQELLGDIETVYIGGGTPSHVGNKQLSRLLYTLSLSLHLTPEVECSLEANPESLTEAMVKDLFALGVNRLSLGVQSFDDRLLKILGRVHDGDAARRAIDTARLRFDNVSVDLMCGLPTQTPGEFVSSLDEALACGVNHVSIYPLVIEEGTPFDSLLEAGEIPPCDDDEQAEMMESAATVLEGAGMHRYEVASYAMPGYECRHNTAYWSAVPYLGIGSSAVSMRQNDSCRVRIRDGKEIEKLNRRQMVAEDLMLAMRMTRGISEEYLDGACGELPEAKRVFDSLVEEGLVDHVQGSYRPTSRGWLCGNVLFGRVLDLAP